MAPYEVLYPLGKSDEWQNLPPTVKRKCFSSLERLRLGQSSLSKINGSASLNSSYGTAKSKRDAKTSSRPPLTRRNSSYFKKTPSPTNNTFSQSDAQWFLRLPKKVQRGHFTSEERNLLSGQTDSDAIDEKFERQLYKLSRESNLSTPTLRTSSSSSLYSLSSLSTFDLDQPVPSTTDMDDSIIWFDDDNDGDLDARLQLDDYHQFINKAAETKTSPSNRRPSFRRALSLSSLPFGASTSSSPKPPQTAVPPIPPLPKLHIPQTSHQQTKSQAPPSFHSQKSTPFPIEPPTRHYQDPEARLKLRVYLGSPQKFDEALEFGFPSLEDKGDLDLPLHRPSLPRSYNTAPCSTFLHDDSPSVFDTLDLDGDDSDAISVPDRDSPNTPLDSLFQTEATLLSPSEATSFRSSSTLHNNNRPTIRHHRSEPFAQLLAGSREMTLRMTLTRPDLRADEKALYAHTTGDDPLALEHLPPTKNEAEIWDTLPKDNGVVKRFWRKVSGKS